MTTIFIAQEGALIPLENVDAVAFPWAANALAFIDWFKSNRPQWTLHTSGSTGTPKEISWERSLMDYSAQKTFEYCGIEGKPLTWIPISCEHAGGIMMLHRALLLETEIWLSQPATNPWIHLPADRIPEFCSLVPLQLEVLQNNPALLATFAGINTVLIGGAAVSEPLAAMLSSLQNKVFHTYGMTETYSHIALRRLSIKSGKWFELTDPAMSIRSEADGTIGLRGPITENEWIKTNDLVEIASHGKKFVILGRADDVINSGGVKVNPHEIERIFQKWMYQNQVQLRFAVVGLPDERLGNKVVAALENKIGADFVVNSWKAALKDKLPPYYFPKTLLLIDEWPQVANGKTDRKSIRAQILNLNME